MRRYIITAFAFAFLLAASYPLMAAETEKTDTEGVIHRTITIEGEVDKPRTIFIVPKARFFGGGDYLNKSYRDRLLEPLRPESTKDILSNG